VHQEKKLQKSHQKEGKKREDRQGGRIKLDAGSFAQRMNREKKAKSNLVGPTEEKKKKTAGEKEEIIVKKKQKRVLQTWKQNGEKKERSKKGQKKHYGGTRKRGKKTR